MQINLTDDDVVGINLGVRDPVLAGLLREVEESEWAELVGSAVEVGARVLQRHQDGAQGDLLRREVERLEELVTSVGRENVDRAGAEFAQAVSQVMQRVSDGLATITGKLDGALAADDLKAQVESERQRGTAKGRTYEEQVVVELDAIAAARGDVLEATGDLAGAGGRSGDAVAMIGAAGGAIQGRVVFEAKAGRLSRPEAIRELDRAMEVRDATYGVLVVLGEARVPAGTDWLREIGGNKVVVPYDPDVGPLALEVAYALARVRALASESQRDIDAPALLAIVEGLRQRFQDVRRVKSQMTSARTAIDAAASVLDEMAVGVQAGLQELEQVLS